MKNYLRYLFCLVAISFLSSCMSLGSKSSKLVKYSYEGAKMTVFTGAKPPWNEESRMSGYFVYPELAPSTTYDFLDPDIIFPFPNLPKEFSFTDGARTITDSQMEDSMKTTANRLDPSVYECRTFNVRTDQNGDIEAWDILFVHDVRASTFLTSHNGSLYGQDLTEVDATHWGCVATNKCTANANYTNQGPIFDSWVDDLQYAGKWTKEAL
ncbi:MAG: hypothetical protein VYA80_07000 [Pseudomonadota bacterium]|nr:hypothetical protein [Pseudomonadota bacterium]